MIVIFIELHQQHGWTEEDLVCTYVCVDCGSKRQVFAIFWDILYPFYI